MADSDSVGSHQDGGHDSNCEDDLRQKREGTVIEFLDETEAAFKNFTPHSYLIEQSKTADHECERNAVPGMIRDKSDWSENGAVQVKQSGGGCVRTNVPRVDAGR